MSGNGDDIDTLKDSTDDTPVGFYQTWKARFGKVWKWEIRYWTRNSGPHIRRFESFEALERFLRGEDTNQD